MAFFFVKWTGCSRQGSSPGDRLPAHRDTDPGKHRRETETPRFG